MIPRLGVALCLGLLAACGRDKASRDVEHFAMESTRPLPFSAAVRVGDLLFLSGQLGTDSSTKLVPGGIGPETRQAMDNVRAVLARAGATMDDLVKCTAMLADMSEWGAMNAEYVKHFQGAPHSDMSASMAVHFTRSSIVAPARSAFGTTGLALGGRVEIECIARVR
jgi:2-iminobutanoate/2-iminopropanoate deaminase